MLMSWAFSLTHASVCAYVYARAYTLVKTSLNHMYPRLKRVFEVVHMNRGPVHTAAEEFENEALYLRLGLPSTLRTRHANPSR